MGDKSLYLEADLRKLIIGIAIGLLRV